jgi:hypothetical protein
MSMDDGVQFKGRIEIDPTKFQTTADSLSIRFSRQGQAPTASAYGLRRELPHRSGRRGIPYH